DEEETAVESQAGKYLLFIEQRQPFRIVNLTIQHPIDGGEEDVDRREEQEEGGGVERMPPPKYRYQRQSSQDAHEGQNRNQHEARSKNRSGVVFTMSTPRGLHGHKWPQTRLQRRHD